MHKDAIIFYLIFLILYALAFIFISLPWSNIEEAFADSCRYGYLKVAQLLLILKPNMDISADEESAFIGACVNGHLQVVEWLRKIKPNINIFARNHLAFRSACSYGHLKVAELLSSITPIYEIDLSTGTITYEIKELPPIIINKECEDCKDCEECIFCFGELTEITTNCKTNCNHSYHYDCLSEWYFRKYEDGKKFTCPRCSKPINAIFFKSFNCK